MVIQHVGLYSNPSSQEAQLLSAKVADALQARQVQVYTLPDMLTEVTGLRRLEAQELALTVDLVFVIGGDGTVLRAARLLGVVGIPLLGINKGHMGFLSELEEEEFFPLVDDILAGKFRIESRMTIAATVIRDNEIIATAIGLNDLVINRSAEENLLAYDLYLGEALIDRYSGDGLITATPTGSTGYSLSAGGPLIYPGTDCLIVTPICSHFLGTRAVIVPADGVITVVIRRTAQKAYFVADGEPILELEQGDYLEIGRAREEIRLVHLREHPFFEAVRNKLLNSDYRKL